MAINLTFLQDGANGQALSVATELAEFISAAKASLHIAIYDFRLKQEALSTPVIKALKDIANKGVRVRIAFYAGKQTKTKGDKSEAVMDMDLFLATGGDPSQPYKADGKHDFMHNKVVVCDDVVVTGSFNFSRSATQNAENILVLPSKELADQYSAYIDERTAHYKGLAK